MRSAEGGERRAEGGGWSHLQSPTVKSIFHIFDVPVKILRGLLFPFALLYGIGMFLRNKLFDLGIFKSVEFDIPVICIGNISTGGTGKTPHIEYLIRLLGGRYKVATLSRGYGRKTSGYRFAAGGMTAYDIGDEPAQFKHKFPDVAVAVGENRLLAIPGLLQDAPATEVVLLDDAFQHRSVKPGLSIVLTRYDELFTRDFLLPAGNLREWRAAYRRADTIIVTNCPPEMQTHQYRTIINEINPQSYQKIFFSSIEYGTPYPFFHSGPSHPIGREDEVLLICGIARTQMAMDHISSLAGNVTLMRFSDHHLFKESDIRYVKSRFDQLGGEKYILATEKDAMRLMLHRDLIDGLSLRVYCLPIQVKIREQDREAFHNQVFSYMRSKV